jgi:hypothetical protein
LAFAPQVTAALTKKESPLPVLQEALAANPDFVFLAVISKDGVEKYRAAISAGVSSQIAPVNLQNDPSLTQLAEDPHLLVSSFKLISGRPISEFLYPLTNGDYLYGVLSFFSFLARVQQQRIGNTGHIYIVDSAGQIYVSDYQYAPAFDAETFEQAFASKSPLIKGIKTPYHTYVGAYATTPVLGVHVAVLQLKSEAYRNIYHTNIILA